MITVLMIIFLITRKDDFCEILGACLIWLIPLEFYFYGSFIYNYGLIK